MDRANTSLVTHQRAPHVSCPCPALIFFCSSKSLKASKLWTSPTHTCTYPHMDFSSHRQFLDCIVFLLIFAQISQFLECLFPSSLCGKWLISKELGPMSTLLYTFLGLPKQGPLLSIPEHFVNTTIHSFSRMYHSYVLPCLSCPFIYWFNKHLLSSHSLPVIELAPRTQESKSRVFVFEDLTIWLLIWGARSMCEHPREYIGAHSGKLESGNQAAGLS